MPKKPEPFGAYNDYLGIRNLCSHAISQQQISDRISRTSHASWEERTVNEGTLVPHKLQTQTKYLEYFVKAYVIIIYLIFSQRLQNKWLGAFFQ